jgi:hypothetical protein
MSGKGMAIGLGSGAMSILICFIVFNIISKWQESWL